MNTAIDVPEYTASGLRMEWDEGFEVAVQALDGRLVISGNAPGLRSLARLLLSLAQNNVPAGHHVHLDDSNALEDGSVELVIQRS